MHIQLNNGDLLIKPVPMTLHIHKLSNGDLPIKPVHRTLHAHKTKQW